MASERTAARSIAAFFKNSALCDDLEKCKPTFWANPKHDSNLADLPLCAKDMEDAHARWDRLAPLIAKLYPNEAPSGRVSSALLPVSMDVGLGPGAQAFLKADSDLPVCASVKARGGLFEVFSRAEQVLLEAGRLTHSDDYSKIADAPLRQLLQEEEVAVGSTGNLGMSVGLAAAGLGMKATIHMSTDAKEWKKTLLRKSVTVIEHSGQYSLAVAEGRKLADQNSRCHFVDDERSETMFLGYSTAARELQVQLAELGIEVSAKSPLVVYIPCGVGGAPGGICWGLKQTFGENVHVYFAEPTHAPSVLMGLSTGLHDDICVQDLGIDGVTEADGLAVGRPSGLVCTMVERLVAGIFTVDDEELFSNLAKHWDIDGHFMEPSCCASFLGPTRLRGSPDSSRFLNCGTHIFWGTGGALVPQAERDTFYKRGKGVDPPAKSKL